MHKLAIGDVVRVIKNSYGGTHLPRSTPGVVRSLNNSFEYVTVYFQGWYDGHDGSCGCGDSCWNIPENCLVLCTPVYVSLDSVLTKIDMEE